MYMPGIILCLWITSYLYEVTSDTLVSPRAGPPLGRVLSTSVPEVVLRLRIRSPAPEFGDSENITLIVLTIYTFYI